MSAADDVARMLTLVPWLLERPGASYAEIAEAFGVSPATVRADLSHLDFCGLPGLGGGDLFEVDAVGDRVVLRMADELRRPLRPTPREALRLVVTVDAVADALGEELPALQRAVGKIREALGIPQRVADVLDPDRVATLPALRRAVRERRRVRIAYQGRGEETASSREVDPWALHVVDGTWYLQAHDHRTGERRVFRLDRVADVSVLDRPIEQPRPAELAPPRYVPGPDDLAVRLRASARGRWIEDALSLDAVEETDRGYVLALRTDAPRYLAQLVVMAAGEVEVLSPPSLRAQVRALASAARERSA